jgi:hypothetical protein
MRYDAQVKGEPHAEKSLHKWVITLMSPEKPTAPERSSTVRTLIGILTIIGLVIAAFLLAIAWSDGLSSPGLPCHAARLLRC